MLFKTAGQVLSRMDHARELDVSNRTFRSIDARRC